MASKTVEIKNETGLHTRPGNEFVSLAKILILKLKLKTKLEKE